MSSVLCVPRVVIEALANLWKASPQLFVAVVVALGLKRIWDDGWPVARKFLLSRIDDRDDTPPPPAVRDPRTKRNSKNPKAPR